MLRNYAISRATNLSAQNLREMFNELRQHLRNLKLELALFIEDITLFTGIDKGLLDVLITQHTGEGNTAFCRLTSVIGVTDAYFTDDMPDNIKQRVTHQLSLSSSTARGVSDLMQDAATRAEFVARYLNAMRFERTHFDPWVRSGGAEDTLPVFCDQCPLREPCFASFGYVEIATETEPKQIGIYPFNQRSVDSLYRGLRDSYPRTPRTFLFDVLGYILQSHTSLIQMGEFPPAEMELAPAIQPPSFSPPGHRQIVEKQGGVAASRIMSLLLYWGDRSAEHRGHTIGSLPEIIFRAFNLKMIEGIVSTETDAVITQNAYVEATVVTPTVSDEANVYTELIDEWMNTGRLNRSDRFGEWLAALIRSYIDWQAHGISLEQVREYITQGRFEIEGQIRGSQRTHRLLFDRTSELRYVFQALADLNANRANLTQDQYGEHLTTLSTWVRFKEAEIVAFVREPSEKNPDLPSDYLLNILTRNAVLLACLAGELRPTTDLLDLYHQVIASCAIDQKWDDRISEVRDTYPTAWRNLMREVNRQGAVSECRKALRHLANRPQGRSTEVRYVDAAQILTILEDFWASDWTLPELGFIPKNTTDPAWAAGIAVYTFLQQGFYGAVEACYAELNIQHTNMTAMLGDSSSEEVLGGMRSALDGVKQVGYTYNPRLDEPFSRDRWTPQSLDQLLADTSHALHYETLFDRAMYAGGDWGSHISLLRARMDVFELFVQEMNKKSELVAKKIEGLQQKTNAAENYQVVVGYYEEAVGLIDSILQENS